MADMSDWKRNVQKIVGTVDLCIQNGDDEALTLTALSAQFGYSDFYTSRKFCEISGMTLKDYIRGRRLAFALKEIRDTDSSVLDIAVKYGFSSNEAFTRAFKDFYGTTPTEYRANPKPVVLRTVIKPFDCFLMEEALKNSTSNNSDDSEGNFNSDEVKTYFAKIPAHKFLHIRNYKSVGYWDFWQKQAEIPGQDCETICGILDSVKGKLDDLGGNENDAAAGQLMAWINEPDGRLCSWGIPLAESYGVRLPADWSGDIPNQMMLMDVPESEYIVFEHGPFDFEKENQIVEAKIEKAMKDFDWENSGYKLDLMQGRIFYFYHDSKRFWKYVRPVCKAR